MTTESRKLTVREKTLGYVLSVLVIASAALEFFVLS